jgi:hypothetical protein
MGRDDPQGDPICLSQANSLWDYGGTIVLSSLGLPRIGRCNAACYPPQSQVEPASFCEQRRSSWDDSVDAMESQPRLTGEDKGIA